MSELQKELFQIIKSNATQDSSIAEEIAQVLNVSIDSAYRRIRAEKTISVDELQALCSHYKISVDQLLNIQNEGFFFYGNLINESTFSFNKYVDNLLQTMTFYNGFKQKEIYGLYKDIPLFHQYHFSEIAAFKDFVWQKSILHDPKFKNLKFRVDAYTVELFAKEQRILNLYNEMKSIEIWNNETINSIIRQIEYYRASQFFKSELDAFRLYEIIEKLLTHLEAQAEKGYKFNYGDANNKPLGEYQVYFNELLLGKQ